ncbi:MAG: hypothetical protein N3A38_06370 [Planctomycetota bacterium]|nr:hypothetical protein [Planctomycetota bacterium]
MSDSVIERRADNWLRVLDRADISGLVPVCMKRDPAAQLVHVGIRSRGLAVEETEFCGETWVCARVSRGPVWTESPTVGDRRKAEYEARGATIEALTVALWELVVEKRPEAAEAIQEVRADVKAEIAKP